MATRLYIPLPDSEAREGLITHLLKKAVSHLPWPSCLAPPPPSASPDNTFVLLFMFFIFENLQIHRLSPEDIKAIVHQTEGYSGSDLQKLCENAASKPLKEVNILTVTKRDIRPIEKKDFDQSIKEIRASVNITDTLKYEEWNNKYGFSLARQTPKEKTP